LKKFLIKLLMLKTLIKHIFLSENFLKLLFFFFLRMEPHLFKVKVHLLLIVFNLPLGFALKLMVS
jgi:hypothetical protein